MGIIDNIDNYIRLTNLIIFISFVTFTILITIHVVKRKKAKFKTYIIALLCCLGMYLCIPLTCMYFGYAFQDPYVLKEAIKYSINPYEKSLAYLSLADIYNYGQSSGEKDGNLAIEYYEKAINGKYSENLLETYSLATLYSIKGNVQKTEELINILNYKHDVSLLNIYIMNDQYDKALEVLGEEERDKDNCGIKFLRADLYKKSGNSKLAEKTKKDAEGLYEQKLKRYAENYKRLEYMAGVEKYKTTEAYKSWLKDQAQEYKF